MWQRCIRCVACQDTYCAVLYKPFLGTARLNVRFFYLWLSRRLQRTSGFWLSDQAHSSSVLVARVSAKRLVGQARLGTAAGLDVESEAMLAWGFGVWVSRRAVGRAQRPFETMHWTNSYMLNVGPHPSSYFVSHAVDDIFFFFFCVCRMRWMTSRAPRTSAPSPSTRWLPCTPARTGRRCRCLRPRPQPMALTVGGPTWRHRCPVSFRWSSYFSGTTVDVDVVLLLTPLTLDFSVSGYVLSVCLCLKRFWAESLSFARLLH